MRIVWHLLHFSVGTSLTFWILWLLEFFEFFSFLTLWLLWRLVIFDFFDFFELTSLTYWILRLPFCTSKTSITSRLDHPNSRNWPKFILDHSKTCKNRGSQKWWNNEALLMKFSGLVVLKYLFQYPKNHFGQPSTFWAVDHSIWSKIAKNASISYTLEALIQDLDFSRTCGFRREFRKGPSFQKIILSGSLSCLNFRQNSIMCQKLHVFVLIEWSGFFPENPAVLRHIVYYPL